VELAATRETKPGHVPGTMGEDQMMRTVLAVAVLALGVNAATADPIADRQALMKENGKHAKTGALMIRGKEPFDLAKAKEIFKTFENAAAKMPDLFPPNSKTGHKTTAAPKIWEDMADFKAKFATFGSDAKAAEASVKDLATFKVAFATVGKNCKGCHETYRIKKQ
jgi:cytochrome c556